jgi:hypothetical protein
LDWFEPVLVVAVTGGAFFLVPMLLAEALFCIVLGLLLLRSSILRSRLLPVILMAWGAAESLAIVSARYLLDRNIYQEPAAAWLTGANVLAGTVTMLAIIVRSPRVQEPAIEPPTWADTAHGFARAAAVVLSIGLLCQSVKYGSMAGLVEYKVAAFRAPFEITRAPSGLEDLYGWFRDRSRPATLVLVPPNDPRFWRFRAVTGRGEYALVADINQLAYDLRYYAEGYRRLQRIGVRVVAPHRFDDSGYHRLTLADLGALRDRDHVEYAVFEHARMRPELLALPAVYEANGFRVLDLRMFARGTS